MNSASLEPPPTTVVDKRPVVARRSYRDKLILSVFSAGQRVRRGWLGVLPMSASWSVVGEAEDLAERALGS